MKLFAVCAVLGLILYLPGSAPAKNNSDPNPAEKIERSTIVDPQVTVTLCVMSGNLTVRGWDKNEIRAGSSDVDQIDFRRIDKGKDTSRPATRIDVMVLDESYKIKTKADCQAVADVYMDVPVGATVQVQTRDGDIRIVGVAAAYAGSQNGDISIEKVSKLVEAGSVGGSISLKDSSGRINLNSAGGGVDVSNVRPATSDDAIEVGTVSGDIQLVRVLNPKVVTKTVNGTVTLSGPLARAGNYGFTSMGGDLVLMLPHDASFKLNAKISDKEDIESDFPLIYLKEAAPAPASAPPAPMPHPQATPKSPAAKGQPPQKGPIVIAPVIVAKPVVVSPYVLTRFTAICGTGDATISVASFGGTLRLKKM